MASLRKRGKQYHAVYCVGGKERRRSLETTSYQVAKERLRNLDASIARGTHDDDLTNEHARRDTGGRPPLCALCCVPSISPICLSIRTSMRSI